MPTEAPGPQPGASSFPRTAGPLERHRRLQLGVSELLSRDEILTADDMDEAQRALGAASDLPLAARERLDDMLERKAMASLTAAEKADR